MQGLDSLMAIGAAFEMELGELAQTFRIAEAKPLRSLLIRRAEDLRVAFNRAHDSGLYRTMLIPLRSDLGRTCRGAFGGNFLWISNISAPMNLS